MVFFKSSAAWWDEKPTLESERRPVVFAPVQHWVTIGPAPAADWVHACGAPFGSDDHVVTGTSNRDDVTCEECKKVWDEPRT